VPLERVLEPAASHHLGAVEEVRQESLEVGPPAYTTQREQGRAMLVRSTSALRPRRRARRISSVGESMPPVMVPQ
jgi:hypothetical protein